MSLSVFPIRWHGAVRIQIFHRRFDSSLLWRASWRPLTFSTKNPSNWIVFVRVDLNKKFVLGWPIRLPQGRQLFITILFDWAVSFAAVDVSTVAPAHTRTLTLGFSSRSCYHHRLSSSSDCVQWVQEPVKLSNTTKFYAFQHLWHLDSRLMNSQLRLKCDSVTGTFQ